MRSPHLRMDVISRSRYAPSELIRIYLDGDMPSFKASTDRPGKTLYVHKDLESINQLTKRRVLERIFPNKDLTPFYEEMKNVLER